MLEAIVWVLVAVGLAYLVVFLGELVAALVKLAVAIYVTGVLSAILANGIVLVLLNAPVTELFAHSWMSWVRVIERLLHLVCA